MPTRNWVANGGNVFNQRYSPLTLPTRDNVKAFKALWRTSMGSGATPNNSGQAQILHYEGGMAPSAALADWHIDDMWSVYPRPHEPIGYGRPAGDGESTASIAPVDVALLHA